MININKIGAVFNQDYSSYSNNIPAYVWFGSPYNICKNNIIIRYIFRAKNSDNLNRLAAPALIFISKTYHKNIWCLNGIEFKNKDKYLAELAKISTELFEICITNEEFFK